MTDKRPIIDADFKHVGAQFRVGDRHPDKHRWRYTGLIDDGGAPLWYRPPRFFPVWWGLRFTFMGQTWRTGGRFVLFCLIIGTPALVIILGLLIGCADWLRSHL